MTQNGIKFVGIQRLSTAVHRCWRSAPGDHTVGVFPLAMTRTGDYAAQPSPACMTLYSQVCVRPDLRYSPAANPDVP